MSNLPITVKEYENSVLVTDFIRKTREIFNTDGEIKDFRFTPKINGYEISYLKNGETTIVSLELGKQFDGLKIKTSGNDFRKTFCSKTVEDNTAVIKEIF